MTSDMAQTDFLNPQPDWDSNLLKELSFVPGLKELLMLRQVHALEHATVWILSESASDSPKKDNFAPTRTDNETLGGLSTEQGFYLYGNVSLLKLRQGVMTALQRFREGEWDLAVHPRCGTNMSVALLLTAGITFGSHIFLPKEPLTQLFGVGCGVSFASAFAPEIGQWAQKYITTAVPFNLALDQIYQTTDFWGRSANFVQLRWQNLQ